MKTKKIVFSIAIFLSIIMTLNICVLFSGCKLLDSIEGSSKEYHDKKIYIEHSFRDIDTFGERVYHTGAGVDLFMPKYGDIKYNYSDIDFYIFDGTATLSRTAVTFVLDLMFDNEDDYEEAKQNELSTRTFRTEYEGKKKNEHPVFEFSIGDFFCRTVYDEEYPRYVGLICLDENSYILRYLFFEEWESARFVKGADYIFKCSNCPWENLSSTL